MRNEPARVRNADVFPVSVNVCCRLVGVNLSVFWSKGIGQHGFVCRFSTHGYEPPGKVLLRGK